MWKHNKPAMLIASLAVGIVLASASAARADDEKKDEKKSDAKRIDCTMTFTLKGWSAFYKTAKGTGTVSCDNGKTANVTIKSKGGGLTFGKSEILNGHGKFSDVASMDELFGSYAEGGAHAGVVKSASAQVLTKGEVSLALSGTGSGVDIGIDFGKFTIERAK